MDCSMYVAHRFSLPSNTEYSMKQNHCFKLVTEIFIFTRSEHERHSPTCPFVKGEYTQNVPLSGRCGYQVFFSGEYQIQSLFNTT